MLISLTHKFVFIANLKTASSAIERALEPYAEIAVRETRLGKHLPLIQIEKRFSWLFQHYPRKSFFVFGVMRDPLDYLISLYNFHSEDRGDAKLPSAKEHTFHSFVEEWTKTSWQAQLQKDRFIRDDAIAIDALLDFANLEREFDKVCEILNLKAQLAHSNVSAKRICRDRVNDNVKRIVEHAYLLDYEFYKKYAGMRWTGKSWEPIDPNKQDVTLDQEPSSERRAIRTLINPLRSR